MDQLVGIVVMVAALITVFVKVCRSIVRVVFMERCEKCAETKGGRVHFIDNVVIGGFRHSHFKCDRCAYEKYYSVHSEMA